MATIVETLAGDRRIQLGAESFSRRMSFGNDWQKIAIHVLIGANDVGVNLTTLRYVIGVSNGETEGFASNSLVDFIGTTYGSLTYAAGGTAVRLPANAAYRLSQAGSLRKQGSTITNGPNGNNSNTYITFTPVRYIHRAEIIRTDMIGGYTCDAIGISGVDTPASDFTPFNMLTTCQNEIVTGGTYGFSGMGGANAINAGSYYDSVMIAWENANGATLEISNITIVRYY